MVVCDEVLQPSPAPLPGSFTKYSFPKTKKQSLLSLNLPSKKSPTHVPGAEQRTLNYLIVENTLLPRFLMFSVQAMILCVV